ncbi:superoxide dismutase family protein [Kibdelosporangium aridum]|uniref:Superoxide dismutase, Cu-Zn family n=1 Tax=Kibdelosporangium aridum TaxID=2030 RepID=A0A1W1ZH14_KIBAR|nr:superoxide dismutase family protein [Kibdelosporangium aridum]SMC47800.1 superoxide dismutase, Cu-Zn family [Kibdelosporangium aridum]
MRCRLVGGALLVAVTACSSNGITNPPPNTRSQEAAVRQDGTLSPPDSATNAFTYGPEAPVGARLTAEILVTGDATNVQLSAAGLLPDRGYAVHAHTKPCGKTGDDAGPHFQNRVDPQEPSVDPAYANPDNEIWLDLRTDGQGAGKARTSVRFTLSERAPGSFVVHEQPTTATGPGEAGMAGGRVACLTLQR